MSDLISRFSATHPSVRYLLAALVVALLQTGVLGTQIEKRAAILRNGREVLLKSVPVDPRDLLRGDYVTLSYEISTIPASLIGAPHPQTTGLQRLWVRLARQPDGFWTVQQASFAPLAATDATVVLLTKPFTYVDDPKGEYSVFVDYGIERFYLPEGEGKAIEEARNDAEVSVAVRVNDAGVAQIRQLLVEGRPVFEEPLY